MPDTYTDAYTEGRARDEATRQSAQCEFTRHQVVEAGAGTGKTAVLVARVLAWCLGPGWERAEARLAQGEGSRSGAGRGHSADADASSHQGRVARDVLSRVVAITFTDAGAAEMAGRIASGLLAVVQDHPPVGLSAAALPGDAHTRRTRAQALLDVSDQLRVQTIHAFCRRLLANDPLAVDLHPRFEVDPESDALRDVVREVMDDYLQHAYLDGEASPAFHLGLRGIGPREIESNLVELLEAGVSPYALADDETPAEITDTHLVLSAQRIAGWRRRFLNAMGAFVDEFAEPLMELKRQRAQAELAALLNRMYQGLLGLPDLRDFLLDFSGRWREEFEPKHIGRLRNWANGTEKSFFENDPAELGEENLERFSACVRALLPFIKQLVGTDFELLENAQRVLGELFDRVRPELRRRGVMGYAGLLSEAARLLAENPDIAARIRGEIDQLLVDEFQDTDILQCRILNALVGDQSREGPVLFLVGDPKQSIYGWRNADLASYYGFIETHFPDANARGLLCVNHRSVEAVLCEVERSLAPLFAAGEHPWQAPFEPLLVSPANQGSAGYCSEGAAPVERWVSCEFGEDGLPNQKTRGVHASALEARAVAADIRRHVDAGARPGDFALLLRGTGDLDVVLAALRNRNIDYHVERDLNYYRRREIIDIAALVSWLIDPNDHLACVTVLRSALVGVPDAALLPLFRIDFAARAGLLQGEAENENELAALCKAVRELELPGGMPAAAREQRGWRDNLVGLLARIGPLRRASRTLAADRFTQLLRRTMLFEASEAARPLSRFRLANLDRFFRELAERLAGNDPAAVGRFLRGAVSERREAEEGRPRAEEQNTVRVMSIHKAKGLDFEHVYVLQLHRGVGGAAFNSPGSVVSRRGRALALTMFNQETLEVPCLARDEEATERAERVRLLYVAMTRAKQRLVMAGSLCLKRRSPGAPLRMLEEEWESGLPDGWRAQNLPLQLRSALPGAAERTEPSEPSPAGFVKYVFPGRDDDDAKAKAPARKTVSVQRIEQALRDAQVIEARCARARRRMLRPGTATASSQKAFAGAGGAGSPGARAGSPGGGAAHAEDMEESAAFSDQQAAARGEAEDAFSTGAAFDEAGALHAPALAGGVEEGFLARTAGSAVHAALEAYEPGGENDAPAIARAIAALEASARGASPGAAERIAARGRELFQAFLDGPLHERFCRLAEAGCIRARELPVLLPPPAAAGRAAGAEADADSDADVNADANSNADANADAESAAPEEDGPLLFVSGSIDMVYEAPDDEGWVVVDYKSDRVEAGGAAALAERYRGQGEIYCRALQEALALPQRPRFELWLLTTGEAQRVD